MESLSGRQMGEFALNMMNFVFKMMNFALKMMYAMVRGTDLSALATMLCVVKSRSRGNESQQRHV